MRQMIPSFVFKGRAWAAIKPWLQALVVIGLLAMLPGLINEVTGLLLSDDMAEAISGPLATEEEFLLAVKNFFLDKGWIMLLVAVLELLLTPALMMPLYGSLMDSQRKKEVTFGGAMKYLRLSPKALLLEIWIMIRVQVWMLPGMAAMILGIFIPGIGEALIWVGFLASMVLGIRAGLHYGLASIVFADDTALSPNACVRISWEIMRRRKMELFCLNLSFIGWDLLISFASMMIMGIFGTVIGNTVSMMASLLLSIYVSAAQVCFFLAYSGKLSHEAQAADHGEDDPLN